MKVVTLLVQVLLLTSSNNCLSIIDSKELGEILALFFVFKVQFGLCFFRNEEKQVAGKAKSMIK